ncbi:hypothetical protein [Ornithinibacillus halophilus]|uniref:Uncharacterized protein n=1 Tax=Ornithinibacillus halophilus TaxID=930117 RepID=A0A1M5F4E6_9BACI|nr:hypothetical protein [Ornithinibacillus halophilus]SHF86413.1 hypothetical protein SAMN05216225_100750 [Ornithinibacillus halophilus]
MSTFHVGDMIIQLVFFLITLLPIILLIVGIVYLIRFVKRAEQRADERLQLDKENATFQKEQTKVISELNNRLGSIEKVLKDVE